MSNRPDEVKAASSRKSRPERQFAQIHIQHPSMRERRREPYGYGSQEVTHEQMVTLEKVAVETFADMVSAGHTFQAALAAVYYSGMVHALEVTQ